MRMTPAIEAALDDLYRVWTYERRTPVLWNLSLTAAVCAILSAYQAAARAQKLPPPVITRAPYGGP